MEDAELNLLLKYPLMSKKATVNSVTYTGSIEVYDEDYQIFITASESNSFKFNLPEKLTSLEPELNSFVNRLHQKNILSVLDDCHLFLASKIPSRKLVNHCDIYKHVLYEYSEFIKFYLNLKSYHLAEDLSNIKISTIDARSREHFIEISVNFNGNEDIFNVHMYDLPQDKNFFKGSSNLRVLYDQFVVAIEALQPFFDLMDNLDKNYWILDPIEPKRKCNYRRIQIGENLSVIITIDSSHVCRIPDIKFLGPERLVELYRRTLNENLIQWNPESNICSELLKLLGMTKFPEKPGDGGRESHVLRDNGDCSICFSLRLNEKLPEVVCKNKFCENCYHIECLYEWLMSASARRFFTEVVGQCPNCEKNISCPITK